MPIWLTLVSAKFAPSMLLAHGVCGDPVPPVPDAVTVMSTRPELTAPPRVTLLPAMRLSVGCVPTSVPFDPIVGCPAARAGRHRKGSVLPQESRRPSRRAGIGHIARSVGCARCLERHANKSQVGCERAAAAQSHAGIDRASRGNGSRHGDAGKDYVGERVAAPVDRPVPLLRAHRNEAGRAVDRNGRIDEHARICVAADAEVAAGVAAAFGGSILAHRPARNVIRASGSDRVARSLSR